MGHAPTSQADDGILAAAREHGSRLGAVGEAFRAAPRLRPFIDLAEKLGSFAGQLTETGISKVTITYEGHVAEMKIKALTSAVLSGLLRPMLGEVNVVSAPVVAKERGMVVDDTDVFWAEDEGIHSVPKAGGKPKSVVATSLPDFMAVDATNVYWGSLSLKILRCAKKPERKI